MAQARFNFNALNQALIQPIEAKTKPLAKAAAIRVFSERKKKFLTKFEAHSVSQEISNGAEGQGKFLPVGNLFSFIGFHQGDDPIGQLKDFLESSINFQYTGGELIKNGQKRQYIFQFSVPSYNDIKEETELGKYGVEWATGHSWVSSIERGFTGLDHYYYNAKRSFKNSRSGTAIQIKSSLGHGTYKPIPYIRPLLKELIS